MFGSDPAAQCGRTAELGTETGPPVGELLAVFGAVTITRANSIVGEPIGGQPVYEGDFLETGDDGVVAIAFIDGTFLHLHPNGRVCLDEFNCHAENSSALIRIPKGVFGFIAGKLAAEGRLCVDTPLGQLRNRVPAFGIGSLALGVFTFALVRELKADSTDIAFLDNGTIDYKDLKHGVFEIVTKGDHPQVIIVDDPTQTIVLRPRGSGGVSIQEIANTPTEMARLGDAYSHAYSTYSEGIQDPFFQQWQHANAQPQSTGAGGSSTSVALLSLQNGPQQGSNGTGPTGINLHGNNSGNNTGTGQGTSSSGSGLSPPTPSAYWQYDSNGNWNSASAWSDAPWAPLSWQDLTIGFPVIVTIDSATGDSGPTATAVTDLTVGVGATLEIIDGGLLTVSNILDVVGTVEVLDPGTPTLTLEGPVTVETSGTIEAIGSAATIYFADATLPPPGSYTVDNNGVIAADTGATVFFEQSITKNESGAEIVASNLGTVQFDQGSLENIGTVRAESGATLVFNNLDVENLVVSPSTLYGLIAIDAQGTLNFTGTVTIDNGTLTNAGTVDVGISSSITANVTIENENGGTTAGETGPTTISGNGPNIFTSMPTGILYVLDGSTLTLLNDTVSGGTITVDSGGILILAGTYLSANVHLNIEPGGTLEVFDTTTIDTIQSVLLGQSTVESGTVLNYSNELILGGLTIDGPSGLLGVATVNLKGDDTIGGNTLYNGQTYQGALDNAGVINNVSGANIIEDYDGTVTLPGGETNEFVNTDKLEVFAGSSLTLDTDTVNNASGSITVDAKTAALGAGQLTLSGTTVNSGTLDNGGALTLAGSDTIDDGVFDNSAGGTVTVSGASNAITSETSFSNAGTLTVEAGGQLTLSGDTIDNTVGGSIAVDHLATLTLTGIDTITGGGSLTNSGTISVAGTVSIGNETLTNNANGSIIVGTTGGAADTLTLTSATVTNAGSITVDEHAQLLLNGGDTIDNTAGGSITVDHLATLTLTGIDTITGGGSLTNSGTISVAGTVSIGNETLTNNANGSIIVGTTGGAADTLTLTSATVTNAGSITVDEHAQLLLNGGDTIDNTAGGSITVDHLATLTLTGIDTITGGGSLTNSGTISVGGTVSIGNETLTNNANGSIIVGTTGGAADTLTLTSATVTNAGTLTVDAGGALTLTGDTVSNTSGSIVVDSGALLTAGSTTLTSGSVTNKGTLDLTGSDTIDSSGLDNVGTLTVSGTHNAIISETSFTNSDKIEVLAGGQLTLSGDTVDNASGSITVDAKTAALGAGQLTLSGTTVNSGTLDNGGALTLAGSDTIDDGVFDNSAGGAVTVSGASNAITSETSFSNAGTLTVEAGGQLTLTGDTIDNTVGGSITVDHLATLTLTGIDTITGGGSLTNSGTISVAGTVSIGNETLTNNANGSIIVGTTGGAADTLTLTSATVTDAGSITVDEHAQLLLNGGDTIDNTAGGSITVDHLATLTLTGIDTITGGGSLTNSGTISVGGTVSIGNETLTNNANGSIIVGTTGGAADTLTLTSATVTNAGTLTVDAGGALTLTGDTVSNTSGSIVVDSGALLTAGSTTLTSGSVTNKGTLDLTGSDTIDSSGLDNVGTVTVSGASNAITSETNFTNSDKIEVLAGGQLTLNTDTVDNTSGSITVDAKTAALGAGQLTLSGTTVNSGTLDNGGALTLTGSDTIDDGVFDNSAGGTVTVSGASNAITSETSFSNAGTLTVEAGGQLTLNTDTVNNTGGSITVDAKTAALGAGQLTLSGTTVNSGTLDNGGALTLAGSDTIDDGVFDNSAGGTVTVSGASNAITSETSFSNAGTLTVEAGGQLTLSGDTIDNTAGGSIAVDHLATLTLTGIDTITGGGSLTNSGTISAAGTVSIGNETLTNNATGSIIVGTTGGAADTLTLTSATVTNAGSITVDEHAQLLLSGGDTIDNTAGGSITVDHLATLTLTGIDTITGGGSLTNSGTITDAGNVTLSNELVTNSGSITVSGGHTLNLAGGDTISGGTINNVGLIEATSGSSTISGATITNPSTIEANGGTLTIDPSTVTNTGVLAATNGGVLVLSETTVVNSAAGQIEIAPAATLTVANSTVTGAGSITIDGAAVLTGTDTFAGVDSAHRGTLTNTGTITDNATTVSFTDENVTQNGGGSFTVGVSGETLSLTDVTFTGGSLTIAAGATLDLNNATISGVVLSDSGATINVTGSSTIAGVTQIISGAITVDTGQTLVVDHSLLIASVTNSGTGTNAGTVKVDNGTFSDFAGAGSISHGNLINLGTIDVADPDSPTDGTFGITGVQVTNAGMLVVEAGGQLTLNTDTVSNAGGTITVDAKTVALGAGQLTLSGTTVNSGTLDNGGALTLAGSDTIDDGVFDNSAGGTVTVSGASNAITSETSFSNAGTLTVEAGGQLTLTGDTIDNTAGGSITVDHLATLTLTGIDTITGGGSLTNSGTISVAGTVSIGNETLTNTAAGATINVGISDSLTLNGTDSITGGELTNAGTINIDGAVTFDDLTLANTAAGAVINVGTSDSLTLNGTDSITGGNLTNTGTINADGAVTLDDLTLTNTAAGAVINVGISDSLTLSGVTINGGTINDGTSVSGATISVTGSSAIENANLNDGNVTIAAAQTLTLDDDTIAGVTISGGTVALDGATSTVSGATTIENGTLKTGTLDVSTGQTLTLDDDTITSVTISGGTVALDAATSTVSGATTIENATLQNGTLDVSTGQTLTLDDDTITGVTISGGTVALDNAASTVSGATTIENATLQAGTLDVSAGQTLTLDDDTITGVAISGGTVDLDGGTSTVSGGSTIESATLQHGTLDVATGQTLTLDDDTITGITVSGGTVDLDGATSTVSGGSTIESATLQHGTLDVATGQTLTLDGDTIGGVTISGGTVALDGATSTVSGATTIENATLNNGGVSIAAGTVLTLDGTTVSGTTITSLSTATTTGTVEVDSGKTLTLAGTDTITSGPLAVDLGSAQAALGNTAVLFSLLAISDLNPGDPSVTLTIQASSGSFAAISGPGVSVTGNGDEITVAGNLTDINNALENGFTYMPAAGITSNMLTLSVTDGSGDTAFRTISIDTSAPASPTTTNISASGEVVNAGLIDVTGTTTLISDALFNNGGTVKVESSELLKLDDTKIYGGTITDDGTLEIAGFTVLSGGAHLNVSAGGQVTIDSTATLVLSVATVTGGTINNDGTLSVMSSSKIAGASLDDGSVTIVSGQTLTLDGDTVTGTTFTDTASGVVLSIDPANTLTLSGVTVDGGTINDGTVASAATIVVSGNSEIENANLNHGNVIVESGAVLTLDNDTVSGSTITLTGGGSLAVDPTVTLEGGASITGGSITNTGILEVAGPATLTNDTLTNGGATLQVNAGETLTVSGDTISGGTITIAGSGTGAGDIDITGSSTLDGGATINGGDVTLTSGVTLTLDDVTRENNTLIVTGNATNRIDSGDTLTDAGTNTNTGSGTLTIDNDGRIIHTGTVFNDVLNTTFTGTGTVVYDGNNHGVPNQTLTNEGNTFTGYQTFGNGTVASTIDNASGTFDANVSGKAFVFESGIVLSNAGTMEATGGGTLTFLDNVTNSGAIVAGVNTGTAVGTLVDIVGTITNTGAGTISVTGALQLDGGTISGGTITNTGSISTTTAGGAIDNATIDNASGSLTTGGELTLDGTTIVGGTITGSNHGYVNVDGGDTLTLNGVTVLGNAGGVGDLSNSGTVAVENGLTISGTSFTLELTGAGTVSVSSETIKGLATGEVFENNGNAIDVTGTSQIGDGTTGNLTLDNAAGKIDVQSGTLTIETGNPITNAAGAAITVASTATLQIDDATITNSGTITVDGGLSVESLTLDGSGTVTLAGGSIGAANVTETLINAGNTISGYGHIGYGQPAVLNLDNEAGGTIEASGAGQTLTIMINSEVTNAGKLVAGTGATLQINVGGIYNTGQIDVLSGGTLALGFPLATNMGTVTGGLMLTGGGTLSLEGGTIAGVMNGETFKNVDNLIQSTGNSQFGTGSSGEPLVVSNAGTIEAVSGTLTFKTHDPIDNQTTGVIKADAGATVQINVGTVNNHGNIDVLGTLALGEPTASNAGVVSFNDAGNVTLSGGTISATIAGDTFQNDGNTVLGHGTIGTGNTNLILDNASGTIEATGGTLTINTGDTFTNSGAIATGSGGTLQVDDVVAGTGSGTIGSGGVMVFEAGVASGQTITFTDGTGTLKLADPGAFDAALTGLQAGDIIDLTNETVTSAVWNGSTLTLNGTPVMFAISGGLPAGDTFAFMSDGGGSGGTDLIVAPQLLTFSASPATGTEGSAIPLSLSDTLTGGATLTSLVIGGIPTGATLSDAAHDVLTVTNGSVTITASELADGALSSLIITPPNDADFPLSLVATATASNGYNYTASATENVTVYPTAPTVTSAAVSGIEGQPIALDLSSAITATGSAGDSNTLNLVTLTFTVPTNDTYTFKSADALLDDVFTAGSGQTLTLSGLQIADGVLNDLSITTANASNVSLGISATEQDAQTNVSAPATGTETVTVDPTAPTVTSAAVSGIEGQSIALGLASAITATGSAGDANTLSSVTLTFTVPTNDTYTFKSADASLDDVFTAGSGQTLTLTGLQIADGVLNDLSITTANASNVSLGISATEQDAQTNGSAPATGTETVTVDPTAPTVSSASISGIAGQPMPLNLASDITPTEGSGDGNSVGSVTLSFTVPAGDTFTFTSVNASVDDVFTAGAGQSLTLTQLQIAEGALSDLSLTSATTTGTVLLGISAKDVDTDGNLGAANTGRIGVTVTAPAGVAGSPINLALVNPAAANGQPITVTIGGVPSAWQLNAGTNLGNGVWTVQTDDLSTLTVLTAAAYAGAMMLHVTESWTNADGTTATAWLSDNVEAYAPGSPIFAWSGNDTLTGAGGNDLFVFAQPIGNDTIYNFNVVSDHIDLSVFGLSSFSQLQADISQDASGDAVITIAPGESITLHGVDAAALTSANFVFDQTPLVDNAGTMTVSDGATLPLEGVVDNTGTIALESSGDQTALQLIGDGVTLEGGGQVTLAGDAVIIGTTSETVLTNVDNIISGSGQIGAGDGNLTLVNEAQGTIDANVAGGELILDTGNAITNAGILEASNGGLLLVDDPVSGGSGVVAGGTLDFAAKAAVDVTFDNGTSAGTSAPAYGDLVLGDATDYSGQIVGFTGTEADAGHSDAVDLLGFAFGATSFAQSLANGNLILTATDGGNVATLTFDNFDGTLAFASDSNGGTLIFDPPPAGSANDPAVPTVVTSSATGDTVSGDLTFADSHSGDSLTASVTADGADYQGSFTLDQPTESNGQVSTNFEFMTNDSQAHLAAGQVETQSYNVTVADAQNPAANSEQTVSVSVGGPGNDHFVFAPGIGADTITNFNVQQDTLALDHFANVQSVQELQALISTDAHGDAVINLGHNDSVTLAGVTDTQLQQVIHAGHVLLH